MNTHQNKSNDKIEMQELNRSPDQKPDQSQNKTKKNILVYVVPCLWIIAVATCSAMLWMVYFTRTPAAKSSQPITFTVYPAQHVSDIVQNLKDCQLISHQFAFKLYVRIKKEATLIKAGEYEMNTGMNPKTILTILTSGKYKMYRFTVPEGLNIQEIGFLAQEAELCSQEQFLSLCNDIEFINQLKVPGMSLEGYLFPDTYFYSKGTNCKTLIKKMVTTFNKTFNDTWKARAETMGLSLHDVVILASIIEKETGNSEERPLISSVFHNRLNRHMRLESDPTVIYGVSDYDGRIRYKHLRRVTPYNTYKIDGLPAGPIASPGAQSLKAALYPADTDFLYFVSKNDTTHQFSTNLKDHNDAVRKYQIDR